MLSSISSNSNQKCIIAGISRIGLDLALLLCQFGWNGTIDIYDNSAKLVYKENHFFFDLNYSTHLQRTFFAKKFLEVLSEEYINLHLDKEISNLNKKEKWVLVENAKFNLIISSS